MHEDMPYDTIQGQGHGASEGTVSKFDEAGFLIFSLVFVSHDLELGGVPAVSPCTKKVVPILVKFGL